VGITASDIIAGTKKVSKEWTKQRKAEERGRPRYTREYVYSDRIDFTEVAPGILPGAYNHASGGGKYTVSKRQLFYASREAFAQATGRQLKYKHFAGKVLVQYLNRHPETAGWRITADPRGTLTLPNTGHNTRTRIPCGTIPIDNHLADAARAVEPFADVRQMKARVEWPSLAHGHRYQAVLYIEKEGFGPLLEEARIAERFDLAVLSCKGMSVVAARKFVDHVCYRGGGVPLLVAHDFDKSGFEIAQRLVSVSDEAVEAECVTYEFQNEINMIDLGLRLADAERYGLKGERCRFKGSFAADSLATAGEQAYLRSGRRIELNEFSSPQFIEWLESKLTENGLAERLVPADDVLARAWKRALAVARVNRAVARARKRAVAAAEAAEVPAELREKLREAMRGKPAAWDRTLYDLAVRAVKAGGR
jgi:hypothetical protein